MRCCARWASRNWPALLLTGAAAALVCMLFATERRLGLNQTVSNRYRFHAIPVAVSTLYHHRPHDYTALRGLAMRFQDPGRTVDEHIAQAIRPDADPGGGTYFWVADDRGLADFVIAAFRLFGPRAASLSDFWFLLLSVSLALYAVGHWRTPAALAVLPLLMFGWVVVALAAPYRLPFPNPDGYWGEAIALHESRMFDGLALVAVLHFAFLAGTDGRVGRRDWAGAVPQAVLLVFLYHARSSLGWQYLALFALVVARVVWWGVLRLRAADRPPAAILGRPLFVAGLLAASLVGLRQYQKATYHPDYFREYGQRTFWHNALMGLAYHPTLRRELPVRYCDDRDAVDLVLARMERDDPDLDRSRWNRQAALNSLGNHNGFDWDRYESTARRIYFDLWRDRPAAMAACYAYHKPREVARQARLIGARLVRGASRGEVPELLAALCVIAPALAVVVVAARRDPDLRSGLRSLSRVVAVVLPFSLIPGVAFYPALTTVLCFYLLSTALAGLLAARLAGGPP
jgi:hypothetical protein